MISCSLGWTIFDANEEWFYEICAEPLFSHDHFWEFCLLRDSGIPKKFCKTPFYFQSTLTSQQLTHIQVSRLYHFYSFHLSDWALFCSIRFKNIQKKFDDQYLYSLCLLVNLICSTSPCFNHLWHSAPVFIIFSCFSYDLSFKLLLLFFIV